MNEPATTSEEHALLAVLTALEASDADAPDRAWLGAHLAPAALAGSDAATTETLTRIYHEVIGLVPFGQPPMSPHPKVKRQLMAFIADTAPAQPPAEPAALPGGTAADAGVATVVPFVRPPAAPLAPAIPLAPAAPMATIAARHSRAPLGLAAVLILALGGACAWLYHGMSLQNETIARLDEERGIERRNVDELEARLARVTTEVGNMRSNVSVITSPAVEVCALRPVAGMPGMADVHGILFVAADHQHWYMSLHGLKPAGGDRVYQLWFIGDQGPVSGGTFGGAGGVAWDVGAEHMPAGTREVKITIEAGPGVSIPAGPEVLHNADPFKVL